MPSTLSQKILAHSLRQFRCTKFHCNRGNTRIFQNRGIVHVHYSRETYSSRCTCPCSYSAYTAGSWDPKTLLNNVARHTDHHSNQRSTHTCQSSHDTYRAHCIQPLSKRCRSKADQNSG